MEVIIEDDGAAPAHTQDTQESPEKALQKLLHTNVGFPRSKSTMNVDQHLCILEEGP